MCILQSNQFWVRQARAPSRATKRQDRGTILCQGICLDAFDALLVRNRLDRCLFSLVLQSLHRRIVSELWNRRTSWLIALTNRTPFKSFFDSQTRNHSSTCSRPDGLSIGLESFSPGCRTDKSAHHIAVFCNHLVNLLQRS